MNDVLNAIIIDDEMGSRDLIKTFVRDHFRSINIVDEASSVKSAKQAIQGNCPDLLFLDIQLNNETAFDLLEQFDEMDFDIVFISAYDQYALRAIKHHAFDYLLKPLEREDFKKTVNGYLNKRKTNRREAVNSARALFRSPNLQRIKIPTLTGFKVADMSDIVRLEADSNYTMIFLRNGSRQLASKKMKDYEALLPVDIFCRIHHSHIINMNFIKEYIKGRGGQVVLKDGTHLNVSQQRKQKLLMRWL